MNPTEKTKLTTLKARLTKCNNRETDIRAQIIKKAQGDVDFFATDWLRWRRQLGELRRRRANIKARITRILKKDAINNPAGPDQHPSA